ncbi:MAG: hypothetical protein LCH79_14305 [Proteobacteria bacterium]|nr:hypothetical protein [Pseudomonadota bacterium]
MSSGVLKDHARKGKVLVPPFVHRLGPMRDVSWSKQMIPELCWIALVHAKCGDRRAVELITALTRSVRTILDAPESVLAACSSYTQVQGAHAGELRAKLLAENCLDELQAALVPLVSNYEGCAMTCLYASVPGSAHLGAVREVLEQLYERDSRFSTMVQATAVWLMFDAGILKVAEGLALASFPKIEDYPNTELSRQIGGSIRATLNMAFGKESPLYVPLDWANRFWNLGMTMQPCEVRNV